MRYSLKEIGEQGMQISVPLPPETISRVLAPVGGDAGGSEGKVEISIQPIDSGNAARSEFWLAGTLDVDLKLPCARCLAPASLPMQIPLQMRFTESLENDAAAEEESDDEVDVMEHDGEAIDLEPLLCEQIWLNMPIATLCRPDCKGLCTVCGVDKNSVDCGHEQTEKTSPFAVLAGWKTEAGSKQKKS